MRLEAIFSRVLGIPVHRLPDDSSPVTIPEWNSLKHLELIVEIESVYKVRFAQSELASLRSVGEIRSMLSKKGIGGELGRG